MAEMTEIQERLTTAPPLTITESAACADAAETTASAIASTTARSVRFIVLGPFPLFPYERTNSNAA